MAYEDDFPFVDTPRKRTQLAAREGRVSVEIPPYVVSAPEWAARWGETAPPVGTVLRWTTNAFEDGPVSHVAICTGDDTWNVTGARNSETFASVARLIANSPCSVAVDWREIPTVEARPAGDDAVKDWASQFLAPAAPTEGH